MAEEIGIGRESQDLRAEAEETREGLVDKLETLEQGIKDTWQGATSAMSETVDSVKATVGTTVQAVQGAVHDTGAAMGRAFDLPAHVRQYPWLMVGGALVLGWAAGYLVRSRR